MLGPGWNEFQSWPDRAGSDVSDVGTVVTRSRYRDRLIWISSLSWSTLWEFGNILCPGVGGQPHFQGGLSRDIGTNLSTFSKEVLLVILKMNTYMTQLG